MGTDTRTPSNAVAVPAKPAESFSNENLGLIAELRLTNYLLAEGLGITDDLDALREQLTPFKL